MEDLTITGTQIKEIPMDFLVSFDPTLHNLTDQVMDINIKQNGNSDHFSHSVEGKVITNNKRLSKKRNHFNDTIELNHTSNVSVDVPPSTNQINTVTVKNSKEEDTDLGGGGDTKEGIPHLYMPPLIYIICSGQRLSADSGIAIQDINDRESVSHGNSTENSLTESTHRGETLLNHLLPAPIKNFDSLKYGTKRARDSMLLSQLCVVTVSLPSDVQQGQKGRGAILKFRFSPYTQIETLRVAILKVSIYLELFSKLFKLQMVGMWLNINKLQYVYISHAYLVLI